MTHLLFLIIRIHFTDGINLGVIFERVNLTLQDWLVKEIQPGMLGYNSLLI